MEKSQQLPTAGDRIQRKTRKLTNLKSKESTQGKRRTNEKINEGKYRSKSSNCWS